jgi:hypothetical protein
MFSVFRRPCLGLQASRPYAALGAPLFQAGSKASEVNDDVLLRNHAKRTMKADIVAVDEVGASTRGALA